MKDNMNIFCPICDSNKIVETTKTIEIKIRKESIPISIRIRSCEACGEEFTIPDVDGDPVQEALNKYRVMHEMLQPSEIVRFRHSYNLSQSELAKLLGFGGATLSRYENGCLQENAHEKLLRLVMQPECLKDLVMSSQDIFTEEKKTKILNRIANSNELGEEKLGHFITLNFENNKLDEYSGFKEFDLNRFRNAVLYFCKDGVVKTKLNKLMFYFDFLHFKEYSISVTGAKYAHIPFGPAPTNYDLYYPTFIRRGLIEVVEIVYPQYSGEKFNATQAADLSIFTESELRMLATVKERFNSLNAKEISDISHQEDGYKLTKNGEIISYLLAYQIDKTKTFNLATKPFTNSCGLAHSGGG